MLRLRQPRGRTHIRIHVSITCEPREQRGGHLGDNEKRLLPQSTTPIEVRIPRRAARRTFWTTGTSFLTAVDDVKGGYVSPQPRIANTSHRRISTRDSCRYVSFLMIYCNFCLKLHLCKILLFFFLNKSIMILRA